MVNMYVSHCDRLRSSVYDVHCVARYPAGPPGGVHTAD